MPTEVISPKWLDTDWTQNNIQETTEAMFVAQKLVDW